MLNGVRRTALLAGAVALLAGCAKEPPKCSDEQTVALVRKIVLEMVGGPTLDASLAALAPFGRLATFGMASRKASKPITSGELMSRSRAVVGFWLAHAFAKPVELLQPQMAELMSMVEAGTLKPIVGGTYPLDEAHRAHEDLLSRASQGKRVLACRP